MPCAALPANTGGQAVDKGDFFERNLRALSERNPPLCSRLAAASTGNRYQFQKSRSGELIPAFVDDAGCAHPLHSTIDPKKEAQRLISSLQEGGGEGAGEAAGGESTGVFAIFLGLGAGFVQEAALNSGFACGVLVIEFDIGGVAALMRSLDYSALLADPRFTLLVDPAPDIIERTIFDLYYPALFGGITMLPLRSRTGFDKEQFGAASGTVQHTIEKVSQDYSVQAHFGMRWFANIIRNLAAVHNQAHSASPAGDAAICAAGPSLDMQLPLLAQRRRELFVIAADTALPALLQYGLTPDAVVSIDCQHISYYHFAGIDCRDIPLFLDIASPPMLSHFSAFPFFFSGGHPLAAYISQEWRPLPMLDTSGGNVTYACLSLAESLGARRITVYGADFSYPQDKVYARGTYIHPFFERRQERRRPLEALLSAFLYRSPFLPPQTQEAAACRETESLRFYRKRFEQKASAMSAEVIAAKGLGVPLEINRKNNRAGGGYSGGAFTAGKASKSAAEFLEQYRRDIDNLPVPGGTKSAAAYLRELDENGRRIFATLLPQAAAIRHRRPELDAGGLIDGVKRYCIGGIEKVLNCTTTHYPHNTVC